MMGVDQQEKRVVGLVGEMFSGKETFGQVLISLNLPGEVVRLRFSDILREHLDVYGLPHSRGNLQKASISMKTHYYPTVLTDAMYQRIQAARARVVLIDGLRWLEDEAMIKKQAHGMLVYVTADMATRYQRVRSRKDKVGEDKITYEQFLAQHLVDTEVDIPEIGSRAEVKIENNGTPEKFQDKIAQFNSQFLSHPVPA